MGSPFHIEYAIHGQRFVEDIPGVSDQAWLWAISILAILYAVLVLIIRGVIKWGCFGVCDWVLLAAYVSNSIHTVTHVFLTVSGHMLHHTNLPLGGSQHGVGQSCRPR